MYYFITWWLYDIKILSSSTTDKISFFYIKSFLLNPDNFYFYSRLFYVKALLTFLSRLYMIFLRIDILYNYTFTYHLRIPLPVISIIG